MAKRDGTTYRVTIRGEVPQDLVRRVSSAHAEAIVQAGRTVMVVASKEEAGT